MHNDLLRSMNELQYFTIILLFWHRDETITTTIIQK